MAIPILWTLCPVKAVWHQSDDWKLGFFKTKQKYSKFVLSNAITKSREVAYIYFFILPLACNEAECRKKKSDIDDINFIPKKKTEKVTRNQNQHQWYRVENLLIDIVPIIL